MLRTGNCNKFPVFLTYSSHIKIMKVKYYNHLTQKDSPEPDCSYSRIHINDVKRIDTILRNRMTWSESYSAVIAVHLHEVSINLHYRDNGCVFKSSVRFPRLELSMIDNAAIATGVYHAFMDLAHQYWNYISIPVVEKLYTEED